MPFVIRTRCCQLYRYSSFLNQRFLHCIFFCLTCHFQSSENGSPVERIDEGAIVATVCKKRKGNGAGGASVEINVGDGRIISLSNPGNVRELDSGMKATAASQLKVLADQMASLMAQLQS